VKVYVNTLAKLKEELPRKRRRPRAVYFSPSSDAFQPVPDVLDLACDVFRFLFEAGIGVAFLTKGVIPQRHMDLLLSRASEVRAQIGLTTLDDGIARAFEPHAATPRTRLEQARTLVRAGVPTEIRMDPILPGVTDDEESFADVCAAVSEAGVKRIAASLLFLRPAVIASLKRRSDGRDAVGALLARFTEGRRLGIHAEGSSVTALPMEERRRTYAKLRDVARHHGIEVEVCACKNPDLAVGTCNIAGDWPDSEPAHSQASLPEGTGGANACSRT
jgi:DNA repair photolyase